MQASTDYAYNFLMNNRRMHSSKFKALRNNNMNYIIDYMTNSKNQQTKTSAFCT